MYNLTCLNVQPSFKLGIRWVVDAYCGVGGAGACGEPHPLPYHRAASRYLNLFDKPCETISNKPLIFREV
jgi:hypothetical protein